MRKALKLNLTLVVGLAVVVLVVAYFYLPKIFGDTIYPIKYQEHICKYSAEYGVNPALVAAVIMQESRWNPNAVSPKGAQGLMQFMPGTAQTVAKMAGKTSYDIYDPETSVQFGAIHLRDLLVKYNGNIDAALAGYNAGTGNADKWLRMGILGNIPFGETRKYVVNVKNYTDIYASLYPKELCLEGTDYEIKLEKDEQQKLHSSFWNMFFERYFGSFIENQDEEESTE